jgi:uncharacterized protein
MALDRLLIFAKAPLAGRVKTRLTPPFPPDEAAAIYEASLRDVVALAARERARVEIWYHADARADVYFTTGFPHIVLERQAEGDLGSKLADAFERSFADGAQRVLILGSDVPTLPDSMLSAALDHARVADVVIGPALDGGYYLIALNHQAWPRARDLFTNIAWSTDTVFHTTASRAEADFRTRVLPGWYDVDTLADLRQALLDASPDCNLARWAARPEALHFLHAG